MDSKQNAVRGGMQGGAENNNRDALPGRRQSLKFYLLDARENFIRVHLKGSEPDQ